MFESGVVPVSRFVGKARISDATDLTLRVAEGVQGARSGELAALLLVEAECFPRRSLEEEEVDEILWTLANSARMIDHIAELEPGIFAVYLPALSSREEARRTDDAIFRGLSGLHEGLVLNLGLVFLDGRREAPEVLRLAYEELEVAREAGSWSARVPVRSLRLASGG